jgi:hypothetical protein
MTSTVLATYDNIEKARDAVDNLVNSGYSRGDIGFAVYEGDGHVEHREHRPRTDDVDGAEGAGAGATFGAILGAAVGLAAITIPGIGPIVAAGPLGAALGALAGGSIGAAAGAVTGGITASLVDMGVPEEDAHYYAESLRSGMALVSVTTTEADADRAMYLLQQYNPVDIDQRVSQWRARGWTGYDPMTEPFTAEGNVTDHTGDAYDQDDRQYRGVRRYPRS